MAAIMQNRTDAPASVRRPHGAAGSKASAAAGGPRGRGRPRALRRQDVVGAALEVATEGELADVSMRTVADRLGVHQTTLYTYVDSKDDLLQAMLDAVFATRLDVPPLDDPRTPADQLRNMLRQLRQLALDHFELLGLLGRYPATSAGQLRSLERILELLARMGLGPAGQAAAYAVLFHVTVSSALVTGNHRHGADGSQPHGDALPRIDLPSASDYPSIAAIAAERGTVTYDDLFERLLDLVLDVLVPALAATPRQR